MRVLYIFTFMYSLEIWDKTGTLEKELRIFKDLHDKHKISFTFLTYGTVNDNKYSLEKHGIKGVLVGFIFKYTNQKTFCFFMNLLIKNQNKIFYKDNNYSKFILNNKLIQYPNKRIVRVLKNEDLDAMYGDYIFYISSSIFEGNPKTVLEAMSNGCVPLLSDIENHQELVEDGKSGYLISNDQNFLGKIQEITDDKIQLEKVGQNAKTYVQKNNGINKLVDEIYNDFLLLTR